MIIRGGWRNVPSNLKCKTDLKRIGLRPGTREPEGWVWNSYKWIGLYDVNKARLPRPLTDKQKAALEKGRKKLEEMLTCSKCQCVMNWKREMVEDICIFCYDSMRLDVEWKAQQLVYEEMKELGTGKFISWMKQDFVILDTETTGIFDDEIIELSIISREGKVLFDSFIKPTVSIPEDAIEIHGINDETVKDAPSWAEVWPQIKEIISSSLVLIFNEDFDISMIHNTCSRHNINISNISINSDCVMKAYANYRGSERWISLTNATGIYTEHRALSDCQAVLSLINTVCTEVTQTV